MLRSLLAMAMADTTQPPPVPMPDIQPVGRFQDPSGPLVAVFIDRTLDENTIEPRGDGLYISADVYAVVADELLPLEDMPPLTDIMKGRESPSPSPETPAAVPSAKAVEPSRYRNVGDGALLALVAKLQRQTLSNSAKIRTRAQPRLEDALAEVRRRGMQIALASAR